METPEKIYIVDDDLNIKREWYRTKQVGFDTTEYTRTDVVIEKALNFLDEKFYFNNLHHGIESGVFDSEEEMFEDFINYMKGDR